MKNIVRHKNNKPLWITQNQALKLYQMTGEKLKLVNKDMAGDGPVMFNITSSPADNAILEAHAKSNPACKHCQ